MSKAMKAEEYNINPNTFINPIIPEVIYLLGLIWADGYIVRNEIRIENLKSDILDIKTTFDATGKWNFLERNRKNRQPQMRVVGGNKIITDFLRDNDFLVKTESSACKILNKIPENLLFYWFRGLSDGDGCFYRNEKNNQTQYSLCSSYNQDWTYIENILNKLGIKFSIQRRIQNVGSKTNKSSVVRITSKSNVLLWGNYIYSNMKHNKIGLSRKYDKYLLISDGHKQ